MITKSSEVVFGLSLVLNKLIRDGKEEIERSFTSVDLRITVVKQAGRMGFRT